MTATKPPKVGRPSRIPIAPGLRFGRLTVLEQAGLTSIGGYRWKCKCDCGNISHPPASTLRNGSTKSCGCLSRENTRKRSAKDITGQRFGRLVALNPTEKRSNEKVMWRLRCDCGQEFEHSINHLGGDTQSCGCLRRERPYRHGGVGTTLYNRWKSIRQRCLNPKCKDFKNYGGRGILMAPQWIDDYPAFRKYVDENLGPCPKGFTLDRIDNDGNYEPGNLRWAPGSTQRLNSSGSKLSKTIDTWIIECLDKPTRTNQSRRSRRQGWETT